jgi:predicted transposase/invertase (TIGR01784 family)
VFEAEIQDGDIDEFEIIALADPHLKRESEDDKLAIADVMVRTKSGQVIDIEIQVANTQDIKPRAVYNASKMVTAQVHKGEGYSKIKRSVCILITDFTLIDDSKHYHNSYLLHDKRTKSTFTDLIEIDTLELTKIRRTADDSLRRNCQVITCEIPSVSGCVLA